MRPLWTSLALLLVSLLHVEGYTCPSGKSKETITLGVGESVDFSTQETDTYGKNVKCVVKFKRGKRSKCKLNFSCSAFTLTAKNSNCNKGSDFMKIGKEKFCEDNSPDVTVNGRTLNVQFRSNKRSKGGAGAECTATCIDPEEASTSAPTDPPTTTPTPATTAAPTTGSCESLIFDRNSWSSHWQGKLKFQLPSDLNSFNLDLTTDVPLDSLTFWQGSLSGSGQTFSLESPSHFSGKEGDFAEFGFQLSFSGDQEPVFTSIKLNGEDLCAGGSLQSTSAPATSTPATSTSGTSAPASTPTTSAPATSVPSTSEPSTSVPTTPESSTPSTSGSCESLIFDRNSWSGHWQGKLKFQLPSDLDSFNLDFTTDLPLDSLTFWQGTLSGSGQIFSLESPSHFSGKEGDFAEFGFQLSFSGDQEPVFTSIKLNGEDLCAGGSLQSTSAPATSTPATSTPATSAPASTPTTSAPATSVPSLSEPSTSVPTTPESTTPSTSGQCLVTGDCRIEDTTDGQWNDDWGCENANACTSESACLDRAEGIADYCQNESGEKVCTTFTATGSSRCVGDDGGSTATPATIASTTSNPSASSTSAGPTQCTNEDHDYGEVLRLSLLFYEAQRSGPLPANNRIPWRGDSSLGDVGNNGENLTGGYHDAGDYVKFGYPMAGAMTVLAYGGISYKASYEAAGEMDNLKDAIKWGTDYLLKAHVSSNEFYCQVGNGVIDHEYPGRPETMTVARPAYSLTPSKPGSDCIGESAAALASAAVLFAESDPTYSATLVEHAEQLFEFANTNKGLYSSSISDAGQFYSSDSYEDELIWAAAWLYKATSDSKYLEKAEDLYSKRTQTWTSWSFDWADKLPGAQLLLFELTGKTGYKTDVEAFCDAAMAVQKSPGGQTFRAKWGSNRYAANFAFICLGAANAGIKSAEYKAYAASQINYMLGDNPNSFSYVVGYGDSFPKQPHHKAAACASPPAQCTWGTFSDTSKDNPHQLNGALVGGPSAPDDSYQDDRTDYIMAEVTLDYNAGFQSTVAGLKSLSC